MSDFTIGIEEEYQLVDPATGELRSRARLVLAADWTDEIRQELQESTIEIGTRVCGSAAEAGAELRRLRFQACAVANSEDVRIVAAGVHPFSRWEDHHLTSDARYLRMAADYGRIALDEHNYGTHIHIAVPPRLDRILLLNSLRPYIAGLLALAASSPLFEGQDTGFASYRMILWRRWPGAGMPPRLQDEAAYRSYVERLLSAGVIGDERNLYWTIRVHPTYPTLEFRMCDACPRAEDAAAIAAFARALVTAATEQHLPGQRPERGSDSAEHTLLADDSWRAARYGLDATLMVPGIGDEPMRARTAIARLLELLQPIAEDLGDAEEFAGIATILRRGNGADRIREFAAGGEAPRSLVRWLADETMLGTGADRRRDQRPE